MIGLRSLSTQLSGAQVGITVTTLALGFVMEPSLASLLSGPLEAIGLSGGAADSTRGDRGADRRHRAVHGVRRAGAEEHRHRRAAGHREDRHRADADRHHAVPAADLGAQRHRQRGAADLRHRAAGGAAVGPVGRGTRVAGPSIRRQGTLEAPTAGLLARSLSFSGKTRRRRAHPAGAGALRPGRRRRERDHRPPPSSTGHSRFPVVGEDLDDIVGLVHLKRAVAIPPDERSRVRVDQLMVDVPVVPGTIPLDDLLDLLRERGLQMAVVVDEYGGTAGILTLEDVVEELVGEITDEHDPAAGRADRLPDGTWLAAGHAAARRDRRDHRDRAARVRRLRDRRRAGHLARLGRLRRGRRLGRRCRPPPRPTSGWARWPAARRSSRTTEDDLPRPVLVRLSVHRRARRRIDSSGCPPSARSRCDR